MVDPFNRPTFTGAVYYEDPKAALDWLEAAFGFARCMVITTPDGEIAHAEMTFAGGLIYVGGLWADHVGSPKALGGRNTQSLHVRLAANLDAHCETARAAGARIVRKPEDQFYGDRVYSATDLEGHYWSFGQFIKNISREEAEAASGLKIDGWV